MQKAANRLTALAAKPKPQRSLARWLKPLVSIGFLTLAGIFLVREARKVEPGHISAAITAIPISRIVMAVLATIASYLTLSLFDRLALSKIKVRLHYGWILITSFICYTFNFNLGSLIGAVGMRYRLYSKWGLKLSDITRLTITTAVISWSGYAFLTGTTLLLLTPRAVGTWSSSTFQLLAYLSLALLMLYLLLCGQGGKSLRFKRWSYELPSRAEAVVQIGIACCQWLLLSLVLFLFFPTGVSYFEVIQIYLLAAIAGVLVHVPAGLGVTEGVFLLMLGSKVPRETILASLLAFRAVYYLAPLLLALPTLILVELGTRTSGTAPQN